MSMGFKPNISLIIIGLILAGGAGYVYGQSPIAGLREENVELYSQIDQLTDSNEEILERLEDISDDLSETQDAFETLLSIYNHLSEVLSATQSELQDVVASFDGLQSQLVEVQANNTYLLGLYSSVWEKYADLILAYNELTTGEPIGEMVVTERSGIVNGDWEDGNEGWLTQGVSNLVGGVKFLHKNDHGTFTTQSVTLDNKNQGLQFSMKPQPFGGEISLEVSVKGVILYFAEYTGINSDFDWEIITLPMEPLMVMREHYGFTIEDIYDIRFTVLAGENTGANIALDDVSLVEIEYLPEEPAIHQTVLAAPTIDGYVEVDEWADFQVSTLEYWITYNHSIRSDSSAWDTNDKNISSSILLDDTHLYACFIVPDDYLSEEFQIRSVFVYINGYPETTVRWTSQDEYPSNSWATYGANAQYSHSGGGMPGADGIYTIELSYPIGDLEVNEVGIQYAEVTRYTAQGFNEMSSYWVSDSLGITLLDGT